MSTRPTVKFKSLMPHSELLQARKRHEYDKDVDQHAVGPKTVPQEGLNQHHHRQQLYSEAGGEAKEGGASQDAIQDAPLIMPEN